MPTLNRAFVEKAKSPMGKGQIMYRDDKLTGFGLRVTSGCRAYFAEYRVKGVNIRMTIGKHGPWTPKAARIKARGLLAMMSAGIDPRQPPPSTVTLYEVFEKYLGTRKLRPNSIRNYSQILKRCVGDWLALPITRISKNMIESRHRELTKLTRQKTKGEIQANMTMRILRTLINFANQNYETSNGQPLFATNPVHRLSQNKAWHHEYRRQVVIPENKLSEWYQAVMLLRQRTVRDYLIFLLLTGLRRNEAATLRWDDIDFVNQFLTVPAELSKNHSEHKLPLTVFLLKLLAERRAAGTNSQYVFPGRGGKHHIIDSGYVISQLRDKIDCAFTLHDLRRSFLTMAARLDLPHYVIKKLANHITGNDVTYGYIIVDVERLREPMELITNRFLKSFNHNNLNEGLSGG